MTLTAVQSIVISGRDLWLAEATGLMRAYFSRNGLPLPSKVYVSVGATVSRPASGLSAIGECFPRRGSSCDGPRVVIDHKVTDAQVVLAVLVHELIHAADDCVSSHGPWFCSWARVLGLVGDADATQAGPRLHTTLRAMRTQLGAYPVKSPSYVVLANGAISA
ncbi:MAG: SprT-like domain-containing protein [Actinomycetota bacterium]|nr:SprT-like domain-containing protein [Actinomycetota bacterium]